MAAIPTAPSGTQMLACLCPATCVVPCQSQISNHTTFSSPAAFSNRVPFIRKGRERLPHDGRWQIAACRSCFDGSTKGLQAPRLSFPAA